MNLPAFLALMRANQLRAFEFSGIPVPVFSVWDPTLPDARVRDPKKRGLLYSRQHGAMSRMYCITCDKPSPYAVSESMAKTVYKCLPCVLRTGHPPGVAMVPGTNLM